MHKDQQVTGPQALSCSTLLAATIDFKDRVELVEYADGSVGIRINDESLEGYKWDASHAEDGVSTYLRMVRKS